MLSLIQEYESGDLRSLMKITIQTYVLSVSRYISAKLSFIWLVLKTLLKKYRQDNANIIVSSISFYILLTFIPFTLLSISLLGYVIDISNPGIHLERYLKNIVPDPYNVYITKRIIRELNIISLSRKLSGPIGLAFLFFFTTRLFAVIRPSFRIIFGKHPEGFIKGKEKELLFTAIFSLIQAFIFFSFIFSIVIQTQAVKVLPRIISKGLVVYLVGIIEMFFTFAQFYLLYSLLTPVKNKKIIVFSTICATLLWYGGKSLFKYYILHIGKFTAFFGTYGIFIAFLFWIYFSVFVLISCAELQAVLLKLLNREPVPSSRHIQ